MAHETATADAGGSNRIEGTGSPIREGSVMDRVAKRGDGMKAQCEPRWEDLGIEQKIERVRQATLTLSVMTQRAASQAEQANRIAKVHDHGSGGQVVVPIDEPQNHALASFDDAERPFNRIQRLLG